MVRSGGDGARVSDVGIIALVPNLWNEAVWSTRHHVLSRLSRYFPIAWIEPSYGWRQTGLALQEWARRETRTSVGNMAVYPAVPWLPELHRPLRLARLIKRARVQQAYRWLAAMGCRKVIAYLWRPEFAEVLDYAPFELACCYHIDDEYSFSDEPVWNEAEERLIARADQVLVHSRELHRRKGHINPNTLRVPNGVDYRAFATREPEPPDLAVIPRPRIGCVGMLKPMLDWPLIDTLASRHPEWSFIFVGARSPHPEMYPALDALARRPNVYFLGERASAQIPAYTQHLDVCTLPYRQTFYTDQIYPLRLHEYLASGRPAVGTPIETLRDFSDYVTLPSGADEWSDALRAALGNAANSSAQTSARQAMARDHDWTLIVHAIARALAARMNGTGDGELPLPPGHEGVWPPEWLTR